MCVRAIDETLQNLRSEMRDSLISTYEVAYDPEFAQLRLLEAWQSVAAQYRKLFDFMYLTMEKFKHKLARKFLLRFRERQDERAA